jgi:uncharacterized membrane protein
MSAAFLVTVAFLGSPESASAHGRQVNLDEYCAATNSSRDPLAPKFRAVYNRKRGAWTCFRPGNIGLEMNLEIERPLDPRKACEWKWGLKQAHFHQGDNVASQSSVHCGLADGPVARDAGKMTVLRLCNHSDTQQVLAAYAWWDTRNRTNPGWTSEGWYGIERGQCIDLEVAEAFTGPVYIYGMAESGTWTGPDAKFCVDVTNSFEVRHSDQASCGAHPFRRVGMSKFQVSPGVNPWNYRK